MTRESFGHGIVEIVRKCYESGIEDEDEVTKRLAAYFLKEFPNNTGLETDFEKCLGVAKVMREFFLTKEHVLFDYRKKQ